MMSHNMNPFDFVPFASKSPVLKSIKEWYAIDRLVSGFIELNIEALTPVHIVGQQHKISNNKLEKSLFYRQGNEAIIPGSSIRGMLRSFIETTCNCWASQITPYYEKEKYKHTIGFQAVDSELLKSKEKKPLIDTAIPQALPKQFQVLDKTDKIDIASFIFGFVPAKTGKAFKGRIAIEDALIAPENLNNMDSHLVPDIDTTAFMGGAHPSASSWWYQKPYRIQKNGSILQFIGAGYRGRKLYYHQNPEKCVKWYQDPANWPVDAKRNLYVYPAECMKVGTMTNKFRIFFEDIPKVLLELLIFTLKPGKRIRHRIGYGKPYGYGSIEFNISSASINIRNSSKKDNLSFKNIIEKNSNIIHNGNGIEQSILDFLDMPSLRALAKILWWDKDSSLLFTYPRFNAGYQVNDNNLAKLRPESADDEIRGEFQNLIGKGMWEKKTFQALLPININNKDIECAKVLNAEFLPPVYYEDLRSILDSEAFSNLSKQGYLDIRDDKEASRIAYKLSRKNIRSALHFEVFRELSNSYSEINKRTLNLAI